jgi:transposase
MNVQAENMPAPPEVIAINIRDVMAMINRSRSSAQRLITQLQAAGLKRKGRGPGTQYDREEFLRLWRRMDTRE